MRADHRIPHRPRENTEQSQRNGAPVSLEPSDFTVARMLKNAGYATGIYGKWGIGEDGSQSVPNKKGFDDWFGFLNQNHAVDYYTGYLYHNRRKETITADLAAKYPALVQDLAARIGRWKALYPPDGIIDPKKTAPPGHPAPEYWAEAARLD